MCALQRGGVQLRVIPCTHSFWDISFDKSFIGQLHNNEYKYTGIHLFTCPVWLSIAIGFTVQGQLLCGDPGTGGLRVLLKGPWAYDHDAEAGAQTSNLVGMPAIMGTENYPPIGSRPA